MIFALSVYSDLADQIDFRTKTKLYSLQTFYIYCPTFSHKIFYEGRKNAVWMIHVNVLKVN